MLLVSVKIQFFFRVIGATELLEKKNFVEHWCYHVWISYILKCQYAIGHAYSYTVREHINQKIWKYNNRMEFVILYSTTRISFTENSKKILCKECACGIVSLQLMPPIHTTHMLYRLRCACARLVRHNTVPVNHIYLHVKHKFLIELWITDQGLYPERKYQRNYSYMLLIIIGGTKESGSILCEKCVSIWATFSMRHRHEWLSARTIFVIE